MVPPPPPAPIMEPGGLQRELLGQCAGALGAMAQEADRLAGKVVALQAYVQAVRRVCTVT